MADVVGAMLLVDIHISPIPALLVLSLHSPFFLKNILFVWYLKEPINQPNVSGTNAQFAMNGASCVSVHVATHVGDSVSS